MYKVDFRRQRTVPCLDQGYKATSTTCVAYGLGGDFSQFAIGTVYSYYRYANGVQKLLDKIAALYNTVKTRAEKAK